MAGHCSPNFVGTRLLKLGRATRCQTEQRGMVSVRVLVRFLSGQCTSVLPRGGELPRRGFFLSFGVRPPQLGCGAATVARVKARLAMVE